MTLHQPEDISKKLKHEYKNTAESPETPLPDSPTTIDSPNKDLQQTLAPPIEFEERPGNPKKRKKISLRVTLHKSEIGRIDLDEPPFHCPVTNSTNSQACMFPGSQSLLDTPVQAASRSLQAIIADDSLIDVPTIPQILITEPKDEMPELSKYYLSKNPRKRRPSMSRMLMSGYIAKEFPHDSDIRDRLSGRIPVVPQMEYLDVPSNSEVWGARKDMHKERNAAYTESKKSSKLIRKYNNLPLPPLPKKAVSRRPIDSESDKVATGPDAVLDDGIRIICDDAAGMELESENDKNIFVRPQGDIEAVQWIEDIDGLKNVQFDEEYDNSAFTNLMIQGHQFQRLVHSYLASQARKPV